MKASGDLGEDGAVGLFGAGNLRGSESGGERHDGVNEGELLSAEAGWRKVGGVFDAEGVNVFEGGYEAGDFLFHVICFPMILFHFRNNWKIKGDSPPVGGERNTYFEGGT